MVKVFDVSGSKSSLTPPTDGLVAVTVTDDAITLPTSGMPAHGWAKVTNNALDAADFTLAQLHDGDHDVRARPTPTSTSSSRSGTVRRATPPAALEGGVAAIAAGRHRATSSST